MEKKKAPPVVADINVTPMVDVMLVLLIIFMVITPMLTKGVTVDEVRAKNPIAMKDADKEDAVLIAITRNGGLFLSPGNRMVQMDDIPNKVKDLLTSHLEKIVYLKVDQRAKYQVVEDTVDNLRAAGVDTLGLLTELQQGSQAQVTPATMATPGH